MSPSISRKYLVALVAVIAIAQFISLPDRADAGQFKVAMCSDQAAASHAFRFERNSARFRSSAACGSANAAGLKLEVDQGKTSGSKWGRWRTATPSPLLPIVGWSLRAHIHDSDGVIGRICFERTSVDFRCFGDDTNGSYRLQGAIASDGEAISLRLGCFLDKGCDGGKNAHVFARGIELTVADRTAPELTLSGPLLSPGLKAGETFVRVEAADSESGLHEISVSVNGTEVPSTDRLSCSEPRPGTFTEYSPCPKQTSQAVALDTESVPFVNGTNRVEVCAIDVSTPGLADANRHCESVSVSVDNSCPSTQIAAGSFKAGIGADFDQSPVLDYGDSPELIGRVFGTSGLPVSGAIVCVQQRALGSSAPFRELTEMSSGADGRFAMKIGVGPSREFRLIQRSGSVIWVREVALRVRTRPEISLSRNKLKGGGCLEIRGSVPGPENAGVVVGLQGRARGSSRWMTFGEAVTKSDGSMTYRYCFRATSTSTLYELRSVVKDQGVYPYLGGVSAVRRVRVSVR